MAISSPKLERVVPGQSVQHGGARALLYTPNEFGPDENERALDLYFNVQYWLKELAWRALAYDHAIFFESGPEARAEALAEAISGWWEAERVQRASEKSKPRLRLTLSA